MNNQISTEQNQTTNYNHSHIDKSGNLVMSHELKEAITQYDKKIEAKNITADILSF